MYSKEDVKKNEWCASEYDDYDLRVPVDAKVGDVGFVCDINDRLIIKECEIKEIKTSDELPPKKPLFTDCMDYWAARNKFCKYDYSGEFITPERTFIAGMNVVCGNFNLENSDFNDKYRN